MSVEAPTPRAKTSVYSKAGVSMRRKPAPPRIRRAVASTSARASASSGSTSYVPRGTWRRSVTAGRALVRELQDERVVRALAAERREAHVAGVDDGVVVEALEQARDRAHERRRVKIGRAHV